MSMFVLEARDENQKVIGRAEYDNKKWTKHFFQVFEDKDLVHSIRVFDNETEVMNWTRN